MSNYYGKQLSSRFLRYQDQTWLGSGTLATTPFAAGTLQIRITSQLPIWCSVDSSTSAASFGVTPTTAGGAGFYVAANVAPEFVTVSPGNVLLLSSTSTSTAGSFGNFISIAEMG